MKELLNDENNVQFLGGQDLEANLDIQPLTLEADLQGRSKSPHVERAGSDVSGIAGY